MPVIQSKPRALIRWKVSGVLTNVGLLMLGLTSAVHGASLEGPIPGSPPGDRTSTVLEETYPFFATWVDLAASGYVEEEFYLSGTAEAYDRDGNRLASGIPYRTRIIVRRPASPAKFNGTVLMEWQNVTAGYDLDALWHPTHVLRAGYAWIGVSAQRVGVNQLRDWSPTRYGDLDVTDGGAFSDDELSYDIFTQAAAAIRDASGTSTLGGLEVEKVLAIGASQSASRMVTYYDDVLPQIPEPVYDAYGFIVGSAPVNLRSEPVFQLLSETDVFTSLTRRPDTDVYRRWEVAGAAHSGYTGQVYRQPLAERDLPGGPASYDCTNPPFSRIPLNQVLAAVYDHLARWVDGVQPPHAPYLEFTDPFTKARNELGLALGGIQLSQIAVPTALNTGSNSGESFCFLFGTHIPFSDAQLAELYRNHGQYVSAVAKANNRNVAAGFIVQADAEANKREAAQSDVGKP